MTPPVLVDVNDDQIEDIVIPLYNSTLFAFDGRTFQQLWNRTFPSSETYSSPAVGYFNDDDIPDIMIHYQTGPGYPLYYSAQVDQMKIFYSSKHCLRLYCRQLFLMV